MIWLSAILREPLYLEMPIMGGMESYVMSEEDIAEENRLGDMELLAQLVQAEAGNQDLIGRRLVADVVLNRVDSTKYPDTIEEVIFQDTHFSVILDGAFDRAAWEMSEKSFEAVKLECEGERMNTEVLFFSQHPSVYATHHFKHRDHWFGW